MKTIIGTYTDGDTGKKRSVEMVRFYNGYAVTKAIHDAVKARQQMRRRVINARLNLGKDQK